MRELDDQSWAVVKEVFAAGFKTSMCCSVASVSPDGVPNVMPIGSMALYKRDGQYRGFYLERFVKNTRANFEVNDNVCVMSVNSGKLFWLKSLFKGNFADPPGMRLYGKAGELRPAEPQEIQRWLTVVRPMSKFKGHDLLWGSMTHGRDIVFNGYEPLSLGAMNRQ